MGKGIVYTKITPLPSHIPRQLALDMLHSHEEMIKLNPLVTGVKSVDAPRDAASDEFLSQWYEISEIITWGPGMKKKISFQGVFHDQPWGMQSHVYAPMNTDMRNKYRIGGNQPGEPREPRELGIDTPLDGLYLREDVDIQCSLPFVSGFVKKEAQAATGIMIARLTRKAELLDEGKLHAMFENGKLKTSRPNQDPTFTEKPLPSPGSGPSSPQPGAGFRYSSNFGSEYGGPPTPALDEKGFGRYHDIVARQQSQSHRHSSYTPQYQQQGYQGPDYARPGAELAGVPEINELPGSFYQPDQLSPGLYPPPLKPQGQVFRSELPGDSSLAPPGQQPSPQPANHYQAYQQPNRSPQPSPGLPTRRDSQGSSTYSHGGYQVANPDQHAQPSPQQQYQQLHPAHRNSSASSGQIAAWQQGLRSSSVDDPNLSRNSRPASNYTATTGSEPDHQRFSALSIQHTPVSQQAQPAGLGIGRQDTTAGTSMRCPVCQMFEGDEAAINYHVSKAHFA